MPSRYTARHMLRLVWTVGWADFAMKYRGSVLGYFWSLLGPLAKFLVIYTVFRPYVAEDIPAYPLYLFLGIILWEYFAVTTSACMNVLHEKMGFIQKMAFPREVLIYIAGWTNFVVFLTHFLIFALLMAVFGLRPSADALYIVIVFAQMSLLAMGAGMFLSSYSLRYRDIPHLWSIVIQMLFWLTPIMYRYDRVGTVADALRDLSERIMTFSAPGVLELFIRFQPLSILIDDARRALLRADSPAFLHAVWFTALCGGIFLAGRMLFRRRSRYFVQEY